MRVTLVLTTFAFFIVSVSSIQDERYLVRVTSKQSHTDLQQTERSQLKTNLQVLHKRWMDMKEVRSLHEPPSQDPYLALLVSPHSLPLVVKDAEEYGLTVKIISDDVQGLIDQQKKRRNRRSTTQEFALNVYHRLHAINDHLKQLASRYDEVNVQSIGKTFEKEDIFMLTIGDTGKPIVFIECGIHAREWASPAVCFNIISDLLNNKEDKATVSLRERFDWVIIPVLNPDGYNYTWTEDRHWRKNRRPGKHCVGVDINRNFAAYFGGKGSGKRECLETYRGKKAFSEAESQAERNVVHKLRDRIVSVWSIHSFFQYFMTPYCGTHKKPKNFHEMKRVAKIGNDAIVKTHNKVYKAGECSHLAYIAGGTSMDWIYKVTGATYTYTIEVRDSGAKMYLVPPEEIIPTYEETWNGMKAAMNAMHIK